MIRMTVGQKPPVDATVYLFQGVGDGRRTVEFFAAKDNPDWVCEQTANGFWYGYKTEAELDAAIAEHD